jgi:hypothetical protein
LSFDLCAEQNRLLKRFAKNEAFFAQSEIGAILARQNERLKLHFSSGGVNVREGDRTLFENGALDRAQELAANPLINPRYVPIVVQDFSKEPSERTPITSSGVNHILELAQNDADFTPDQAHFDRYAPLPPIVFYGVETGAHIALLDENEQLSNGAIIYESDPEWFLISCYFLDYSRFLDPAKANLLIVGGKMRGELAYQFFAADRFCRGFVRLELALANGDETADAKRQVSIAHKEALRGWGTSEDELIGVQNAIANAKYPRLSAPAKIALPIAIVGNGASLETLFSFLRENQKRLIIFCAGTALKPLLSAGIKPDFHIEIERMGHLAEILRDAPIGDIPLLAADLVDPTTLLAAKESFVFSRDSSAALAFSKKKVDFSSPIVGNAAFSLALLFSDEIYLCGIDVGFRRDRKIHAAKSFYDDKNDASAEQTPTRGNFSADIWTNSLLAHSRASLENAIALCPQAKVFNLSDGAFIAGTKPLRSNEALIAKKSDKQSAIKAIKKSFIVSDDLLAEVNIKKELKAAKTALISALERHNPQNKKELFAAIREAYLVSFSIEKNLSFGAPFLRGSFWRLANALLKTALCVKRSDISSFYNAAIKSIAQTLENLRLSYQTQ